MGPASAPFLQPGAEGGFAASQVSEESLRQQVNLLQVFYDLTNLLNRASDLTPIFQKTLDVLQQILNVHRASILLLDDREVMRFQAWIGLSDSYRSAVEGHSPWPAGERNPEPVLISDAEKQLAHHPLLPVILNEGIRALAFIPLMSCGTLLGKFMLYYDRPHEFSPEELRLAQSIADHVSFAVDRRRRYEEIRKLNEALLQKVCDYEKVVNDLEHSQMELQQKIHDLEKFEEIVVGRELKMMALERELAKLQGKRLDGNG